MRDKFNISIHKTVRSPEWWNYKIAPTLGIVFATAFLCQISPADLLPFVLFLLCSLIPGASYVSLLNDLTDLEEDKLANKQNRLEGTSVLYISILILGCVITGLVISAFLSGLSLVTYAGAWIIFTLYSIPPVRLKNRGVLGILSDSLGSNFFPHLFAATALISWYRKDFDFTWLCLIGIWSFFQGLRGILWHQLKDRKNDQIAAVKTFIQNRSDSSIQKMVKWIIFPIEISAFLLILVYIQSLAAFVFLVIYLMSDLLHHYLWKVDINLVSSTKTYKLFMGDYYNLLFPLALLLANLDYRLFSWFLVVIYISLFRHQIFCFVQETILLSTQMVKQFLLTLREFLLGY